MINKLNNYNQKFKIQKISLKIKKSRVENLLM